MSIALRLSRLRASRRPYVLFCVVISTAVMLAACGTSSTSAPSGTASSGPTPVASGLGATPSASPDASSTASAVEASPGASATAGGGVDACTLITPVQLAEIVGGTMKGAEMPSGGWLTSGCSWGGSTSNFIISIGTASSIQKFGDPAAPDVKAKLQQYKQQANGSDVTGIGDAAVLGANGMAAYKGGTYVEVEKLRLTDIQLSKIMKLLMSRL